MEELRVVYNIKTSMALLLLSALGILSMIVLPFLEPLDDSFTVILYVFMVLMFTIGVLYLLRNLIFKTMVVIKVSRRGISRHTLFGENTTSWADFISFTKVFIPDYFSGYGIGYSLKTTINEILVPKSDKLDNYLMKNLSEWNNDLYSQFILEKDKEISMH